MTPHDLVSLSGLRAAGIIKAWLFCLRAVSDSLSTAPASRHADMLGASCSLYPTCCLPHPCRPGLSMRLNLAALISLDLVSVLGKAPSVTGCFLAHSHHSGPAALISELVLTLGTVLCLYHHLLACVAPIYVLVLTGSPCYCCLAFSVLHSVSRFREKLLLHGDSTASA